MLPELCAPVAGRKDLLISQRNAESLAREFTKGDGYNKTTPHARMVLPTGAVFSHRGVMCRRSPAGTRGSYHESPAAQRPDRAFHEPTGSARCRNNLLTR